VLDVDEEEDGLVAVLAENLIDLDVVGLEGVSGGVPPDELLLLTDLGCDISTLRIISNMLSWKR
jgi:hypothetical protein